MTEPDVMQRLHEHFQRSASFHSIKRYEAAIAELQAAFKLAPDMPEAHFNMGNILRDSGNLPLAVEAYIAAVRAAENRGRRYPEALINLGDTFLKQKRVDYGLIAFGEAVEAAPQVPDAWMGLGVARYDARDYRGAIEAYGTGLALAPMHAGLINNLAVTHSRLGEMETALGYYDRLVALTPNAPEAHTDRGLILLYLGRYREGLAEYEWRWKMNRVQTQRRSTGRPEWKGEDLAGKTVVAYGEQGYGDAFQFARYLTMLTALGAYVIALVERPILDLIRSVPGVVEAIGTGGDAPLPPHDYTVAMMSLPYWCGTVSETIPAKVPYIFSNPELVAEWRARLSHLEGLKVGLVWAGRPEHPFDHDRSLPLAALAPLGEIPGLSFVALQQGPRADEEGLAALRPGKLADFSETAAIVETLDLVLGVDTSVIHLVGAMGKPAWLLLPLVAEWRWSLAEDTSPWYPTMRIFRQTARDDWSDPVTRVAEALRGMVEGG